MCIENFKNKKHADAESDKCSDLLYLRSREDELSDSDEKVLIKHKTYKCYFIGIYRDIL